MDKTIQRLAEASVDIETLNTRVNAIEVILCAQLAAQPDSKGMRLLAGLTNDFEEQGARHELIEELDLLRGIVDDFHGSLWPSQTPKAGT